MGHTNMGTPRTPQPTMYSHSCMGRSYTAGFAGTVLPYRARMPSRSFLASSICLICASSSGLVSACFSSVERVSLAFS